MNEQSAADIVAEAVNESKIRARGRRTRRRWVSALLGVVLVGGTSAVAVSAGAQTAPTPEYVVQRHADAVSLARFEAVAWQDPSWPSYCRTVTHEADRRDGAEWMEGGGWQLRLIPDVPADHPARGGEAFAYGNLGSHPYYVAMEDLCNRFHVRLLPQSDLDLRPRL